LIFDINDFDETFPAPFEWDVKRLATSFVLAARWLSFTAGDARRALESLLDSYRISLAELSQRTVLEIWYARIDYEELVQQTASDPALLKRLRKTIEKAATNTSEHIFHKITRVENGRPRIVDEPPLLYHGDPNEFSLEDDVLPFLKAYRASL